MSNKKRDFFNKTLPILTGILYLLDLFLNNTLFKLSQKLFTTFLHFIDNVINGSGPIYASIITALLFLKQLLQYLEASAPSHVTNTVILLLSFLLLANFCALFIQTAFKDSKYEMIYKYKIPRSFELQPYLVWTAPLVIWCLSVWSVAQKSVIEKATVQASDIQSVALLCTSLYFIYKRPRRKTIYHYTISESKLYLAIVATASVIGTWGYSVLLHFRTV